MTRHSFCSRLVLDGVWVPGMELDWLSSCVDMAYRYMIPHSSETKSCECDVSLITS